MTGVFSSDRPHNKHWLSTGDGLSGRHKYAGEAPLKCPGCPVKTPSLYGMWLVREVPAG